MKFLKQLAFLSIIATSAWSTQLQDFYGYWIPDVNKTLEQLSEAERQDLQGAPEILMKMISTIVIEIQDKRINATILKQTKSSTCSVFELKGEKLTTLCKEPSSQKQEAFTIEMKSGYVQVSTGGQSGAAPVDKFYLKKSTESEAKKVMAQAPSEAEFKALLAEIMQKAMMEAMTQGAPTPAP